MSDVTCNLLHGVTLDCSKGQTLRTVLNIFNFTVIICVHSPSLQLHICMILYCSIRRRALDLLYGMCDVTNAKEIVEELLQVTNLVRGVQQWENLTSLSCCGFIHVVP